MIGALLQRHPKRWDYYLDQLSSSKVSKFKSTLAYEYPTLFEAIAMSVNNLPDAIKAKYMFFGIFDEDSRVPASVLGLLWGEDVRLFLSSLLEYLCLRNITDKKA